MHCLTNNNNHNTKHSIYSSGVPIYAYAYVCVVVMMNVVSCTEVDGSKGDGRNGGVEMGFRDGDPMLAINGDTAILRKLVNTTTKTTVNIP